MGYGGDYDDNNFIYVSNFKLSTYYATTNLNFWFMNNFPIKRC